MAVVLCIPAPNLSATLRVTLPGMGELTFLQQAIDAIPRPSSYVIQALNAMSPALAPVYMLIRVLDVIIAIQNCITALPKAIAMLNPAPIVSCIKKLVSVIAHLLPLLPPLAYVRLVVDIVAAIRMLVEDMISVIGLIDQQVSRIKAAINEAYQLDDSLLLQIGECAKEDLKQNTAGLMQVLEAISKLMTALLGMLQIMAAVLPGPAGNKINKMVEDVAGFQSDIDSLADPSDFPPLGGMLAALTTFRDILVGIETLGKAILGLPMTLNPLAIPQLANP